MSSNTTPTSSTTSASNASNDAEYRQILAQTEKEAEEAELQRAMNASLGIVVVPSTATASQTTASTPRGLSAQGQSTLSSAQSTSHNTMPTSSRSPATSQIAQRPASQTAQQPQPGSGWTLMSNSVLGRGLTYEQQVNQANAASNRPIASSTRPTASPQSSNSPQSRAPSTARQPSSSSGTPANVSNAPRFQPAVSARPSTASSATPMAPSTTPSSAVSAQARPLASLSKDELIALVETSQAAQASKDIAIEALTNQLEEATASNAELSQLVQSMQGQIELLNTHISQLEGGLTTQLPQYVVVGDPASLPAHVRQQLNQGSSGRGGSDRKSN